MKDELLHKLEELADGRPSFVGTWEGDDIDLDHLNEKQAKGLVHLLTSELGMRKAQLDMVSEQQLGYAAYQKGYQSCIRKR